jgi:peroxiredoxin (alkyl hydroperoxide reductase subunit C)
MRVTVLLSLALLLAAPAAALAQSDDTPVYQTGELKPTDSKLQVRVGDTAPNFTLPAVSGDAVTLADYRGRKNVLISFVPAAWTPVCSDQWPGYNLAEELFTRRDTVILGISVDNVPTLWAWVRSMGGLWFPVLSDFWPHGAVAEKFGVLRSDGMAERALFLVDKQGVLRFIDVHDINARPDLGLIVKELEKLP